MSKRVQSKYKINRRLGVNLWGRPKSPVNVREYGPGEHGQRRPQPIDLRSLLDKLPAQFQHRFKRWLALRRRFFSA